MAADEDQVMEIIPFLESLGNVTNAVVVTAAIAYDCPTTGTAYLFILHQVLYVPGLKNNLLRPMQLCLFRWGCLWLSQALFQSSLRVKTDSSVTSHYKPLFIIPIPIIFRVSHLLLRDTTRTRRRRSQSPWVATTTVLSSGITVTSTKIHWCSSKQTSRWRWGSVQLAIIITNNNGNQFITYHKTAIRDCTNSTTPPYPGSSAAHCSTITMKVTSSPQEEDNSSSSLRPRVVAFDNNGIQQNGGKDEPGGFVMDLTNEKNDGGNNSSSNSINGDGPNQTSSRASSPPPPDLDPARSPSISNSYRSKLEKLGLSHPSVPKQQPKPDDASSPSSPSPPPPPPPPIPSQSGFGGATTTSAVVTKTWDGSTNPPLSPRHRENSVLFSPSLRKNLMREQKERDPLFFYEVTQTLGVGSMGSVAKVKKRRTTVGGSARKSIQIAVKKQKQKRRCLQIPFVGGLFRLCIDDKLSYDDLQEDDDDDDDVEKKKDPNNSLHQFSAPSIPDLQPFGKPLSQQSAKGRTSSILQTAVAQKAAAELSVGNDEKRGSGGGGSSSNRIHQIGLDLDKTSSSALRSRSESAGSSDSRRSISSSEDSFSKNGSSRHRTQSVSEHEYAMKSIHLSRVTDDTFVHELTNEIAILRDLDHPNIVRPMETFFYRNQIFIVMELCSGGDLYSRDPYTEEEAARIVSQILSAISYMVRYFCTTERRQEAIAHMHALVNFFRKHHRRNSLYVMFISLSLSLSLKLSLTEWLFVSSIFHSTHATLHTEILSMKIFYSSTILWNRQSNSSILD